LIEIKKERNKHIVGRPRLRCPRGCNAESFFTEVPRHVTGEGEGPKGLKNDLNW
jgi:hypothetical protein